MAEGIGTVDGSVRLPGPVFQQVTVVGQVTNWYINYNSGNLYGMLSSAQPGDNAIILSVTPVSGQLCPQDNPNS
jgi:lipoprotein signal peptidase